MTTTRRHTLKPIVVEIRPSNLNLPSNNILSPSTPPTPSATKRVSFAASPTSTISRPLTSTEAWSLYHFETHAQQCPACHNPYAVFSRGGRLCEAGHWLAEDVACHVFARKDQIYSVRKDESKLVRVEIPRGYEQIRGLLKGMEKGLRRHAKTSPPVLSYDRTYPISSRKPDGLLEEEDAYAFVQPAQTSPSSSSRRRASVRYEDISPSRRGTLYERDMARKEKNYRVEIREPKDVSRQQRRRSSMAEVDSGSGSRRRRDSAVYYYD